TMTAGGRVGDLLRRAVLPRLQLIPGVRDKIVDSTTPALHSSALVLRRSRRRRLTGRLCPNPVLAEGQRFDEAVGPRFAVVTSAPVSDTQRAELARRGAVVVEVEPGTELARWLRRGRAIAAVVRPDATVLYAGPDLTEACGHITVFAPCLADA
ncbi:bifunctional 3-(3-hydroxy-phenyl)propionate/3-hydroxycinnamic acid hydroxylase, partial [Mycobacterium sp. Lab-001]